MYSIDRINVQSSKEISAMDKCVMYAVNGFLLIWKQRHQRTIPFSQKPRKEMIIITQSGVNISQTLSCVEMFLCIEMFSVPSLGWNVMFDSSMGKAQVWIAQLFLLQICIKIYCEHCVLLPSPFSFYFVDPQFLAIYQGPGKRNTSFDTLMLAKTQLELLLAMLKITKPIMLAEILSHLL